MNKSIPNFYVEVEGVKGVCPAGENWAKQNMIEKKTPVLSCEGPCIRGEIARLAANIVAKEKPYARSCYAEVALVPHSSMSQWVKESEKIIMIDGCFLKCIGRVLRNLVDEEKIVHIDALPLYKKYTDIFFMDDVPEVERKEVARQVADRILAMLKEEKEPLRNEG
ncbi:MAG TPA: putative zinc-binding protein [Thermodesulfobacteriota bacterium]|nr:putative zinc-binding protein [Thermodesulfobacteriota bacterium]